MLAVLLIALLERELGLRLALGLVVASLFILAPPGRTAYFPEASGGQVEPLFVALLLWVTRVVQPSLALGWIEREGADADTPVAFPLQRPLRLLRSSARCDTADRRPLEPVREHHLTTRLPIMLDMRT